MSTAGIRRKKRQAKAAQNYEDNPPSCSSCTYLVSRCAGNLSAAPHPPLCNLGKFVVMARGVCDRWTGKHGETLE